MVVLVTGRPDETPVMLRWGLQVDLLEMRAAGAAEIEDDDGQISKARLAGYIAKYATKGTGTTEGTDRPTRQGAHIAHLDVRPHHLRMIETGHVALGLVPAGASTISEAQRRSVYPAS
jgi:hypothetical protein